MQRPVALRRTRPFMVRAILGVALLGIVAVVLATSRPSAQRASYQGIIDAAVEAGVPGVQAAVSRAGTDWSGVSGLARVEDRQPMSRSTRLRLASITKMMTYAVVSELAKAGRLSLDDVAARHVAAGALDRIPSGDAITIAQLLEHRSGLHNFNGAPGNDFFTELFADPTRSSRQWVASDLLAYATKPSNRPTAAPGLERNYSSTGYIVLQAVIEHLERQPFAAAFKRYLFDPLDMTRAGVEGADLTADDLASSYARPAAGERNSPTPFGTRPAIRSDGLVNVSSGLRYYNSWAQAAGAAAAPADDLMRFMAAVKAGRMTVLADQRAQFSAAALKPGASFSWNGGSWGIQATIVYEPHTDVTVVVLTNGSNAGDGSLDIARRLLEAARRTP